ncbi:Rtf2 RING-finger-domain-containing protein [Melampsora americana]|nr:Rtf2 RING-finger-domain-containing protein [Melampsora americana]
MGNDGGSIPKRDDLVKTKHRGEQVDPQQKESTRWHCCALSKRPLEEPIVSDPLGKLYNKSSVLEYLLDNDTFGEDGRQVAGHLTSLRDLINLKITLNQQSTKRICPISLKEMGAGLGKMEMRWVYLIGCGCVLTETGLKQVEQRSEKVECPVCGTVQESLEFVIINPNDTEEEKMKIKLVEQRRREKETKEKRRLEKQERKKRKVNMNQEVETSHEVGLDSNLTNEELDNSKSRSKTKKPKVEVPHSKLSQEPSSSIASTSLSKINKEIQKETQQSLVNLSSSTLNSIYGPRDENGKQLLGQQKESWMTRGTWTRYAA